MVDVATRLVGEDRVLWGCDYSKVGPLPTLLDSRLSERVGLFGSNASRLLGID